MLTSWLVSLWALLAMPVAMAFLDFNKLTFDLYKNMKEKITFPKYTPEQRLHMAQQAEAILSIYVNRESKMNHYGVDPIPKIQDIVKKAAQMTDLEFHTAMAALFLSLRDFHTIYTLPAPYSCYRAIYPIEFEMIDSRDILNEPVLAVKALSIPAVLDFAPQLNKTVQIGDILVSFNGKPFKQLYEENKHFAGGANEFGGQRSVKNLITFRSGTLYPLPQETEVTYVLQRGRNAMDTYTITAPIVGVAHDICILADALGLFDMQSVDTEEFEKKHADHSGIFDDAFRGPYRPFDYEITKMDVDVSMTDVAMTSPNDSMEIDDDSAMDIDEEVLQKKKIRKLLKRQIGKHPFLDELKKSYAMNLEYDLKETEESIIQWSIYERRPTKIGIIRLESFMPETDESGTLAVEIIRGLLINELRDTDAVVFDVRDNGGGLITMADKIPQLFSARVDTSGARALVAPINERIFMEKMANSSWSEAYSQVGRTDKYTRPVKFTTVEQASTYGQVYFKPAAVLNNGNCYSACELFSAAMQDTRGAFIFGEDPQTGGGGANVLSHRFFAHILPEVFQNLPHGQQMNIGWRQTVRFGVNEGKLIEDTGVVADFVVRPRPEDLYPGRSTFSQMQFITWKLGVQGRTDNRKYMSFITEPDLRGDSQVGIPVVFKYELSWLDRVQMLNDKGKLVSEIKVPLNKRLTQGQLMSTDIVTETGYEKYTLRGFAEGNQIFQSYRYIRYIPKRSDFLIIKKGQTMSWDFSTGSYAALYNAFSPVEYGWQQKDGAMVIYDGQSYKDETDSSISFFIDLTDKSSSPAITIKAEFDTEENNDFLMARVFAPGMKPHKLFLASGKGFVDHTFSLNKFVGKEKVEIEIRFLSDPEVTGGTVKISQVSFNGSGKASKGRAVRRHNNRKRPKRKIE